MVSNRAAAPVLDFARGAGIEALTIPTAADPDAADRRLVAALQAARADLVALSGYLRKLGPATLAAFAGRILNVHPGLLPRFGGPGMYGRRVHEAVIAAGERVSGASVHLVDGEYDHGPVIAQTEIPLADGETAPSLEAKVMAVEPELFVATLQAISEGRLAVGGGQNFR